jgi:hypothetical protein
MNRRIIADYYTVHNLIYRWVEQGLLEFDGEKSHENYTDLDAFIFKSFGYTKPRYKSISTLTSSFNNDLIDEVMDLDWLTGPHGLVLYKALLIRRDMK